MSSDFTRYMGPIRQRYKTSILELDGGSIIHKLISIFYSEDKTHLNKNHNFHMYEIVKIKMSLKTLQNFQRR